VVRLAEFSTSFSKTGGYIVTRDAIMDLYAACSEFAGSPPRMTIELAGNFNIQGSDVIELLDELYVKSKPILRLRIDASGRLNNAHRRSVSISLTNESSGIRSWGSSIDVSLSGEKAGTVAARDEIEARLAGLRKWYSLMLPNNDAMDFLLFLVVLVCSLFLTGYIFFRYLNPNSGSTPTLAELSGFLCQWFVTVVAIAFLRKKLFPKLLFDIGKSADQIRRVAFWRVSVCGAVLLGVAINLLSDRLLK
jgi:hypothetical protein